jgi:hypothetical protein
MDDPLALCIVFPDLVVHDVTVRGADIAQVLTSLGPPDRHPLLIIHKERCLCPFISLFAQGVVSGDRIVLYRVRDPAEIRPHAPKEDPDRSARNIEVLRLADLSFAPYESSKCGGKVLRRAASAERKEQEKIHERARCHFVEPAVLAERVGAVSTAEMPICWRASPSGRTRAPGHCASFRDGNGAKMEKEGPRERTHLDGN